MLSIENLGAMFRGRGRLIAENAELRRSVAHLQAHIETDSLLDILNRRGLQRELTRTIEFMARYQTQAAVVVLDIDNFKAMNDCHGHLAGDAMLQATCALLTAEVRKSDLVARWGGDELVVVLWNTDEAGAAKKAEALECAIATLRIPLGKRTLSITASAGISAPNDGYAGECTVAGRHGYAHPKKGAEGAEIRRAAWYK